jgi:hypothetical protein
MAAGAWKVFDRAKKFIGNGTLSLSSTTFRMCLATSASNLKTSGSANALINRTSLTGQVTSTLGCPVLGKAMTGEVWTTGASGGQIKFDSDDLVFTATTSAIANIKFAVIFLTGASAGAQKLLCYSTLTTSQITSLAIDNTLTVQMASGGILTLT